MKNTQSRLAVAFSLAATEAIKRIATETSRLKFLRSEDEIRDAIEQVIANEPRSIYRREHMADLPFGFFIDNLDVTCVVRDAENSAEVVMVAFAAESNIQRN